MECDDTFETAHAILKRDWFLSADDFWEYVWQLSEDVYSQLVSHQKEYALWIQGLMNTDPIPTRTLKLNAEPDAEWTKIEQAKAEEFERWIRNHKKAYEPPPRPTEYADERAEVITKKLEQKRSALAEMLAATNKKKKYVPPSQRGSVVVGDEEPMVRDTRASILALENELEFFKGRVEALNKLWTEEQWIGAIHLDVARRHQRSGSSVGASECSV